MKNWFCIVALIASLHAADDKLTAVRFGKLWDGSKVIDGALVIIQNGRIQSVAGGNPAPINLTRVARMGSAWIEWW
jgi:hypothetical protein